MEIIIGIMGKECFPNVVWPSTFYPPKDPFVEFMIGLMVSDSNSEDLCDVFALVGGSKSATLIIEDDTLASLFYFAIAGRSWSASHRYTIPSVLKSCSAGLLGECLDESGGPFVHGRVGYLS